MFYEQISRQDLKAMGNEYGFTPNYDYEEYVVVRDEETGEITEEYYTNLTIHKTADEVYEEWMANKDKPVEPQPTLAELQARVLSTENAILDMMIQQMTIEKEVI